MSSVTVVALVALVALVAVVAVVSIVAIVAVVAHVAVWSLLLKGTLASGGQRQQSWCSDGSSHSLSHGPVSKTLHEDSGMSVISLDSEFNRGMDLSSVFLSCQCERLWPIFPQTLR